MRIIAQVQLTEGRWIKQSEGFLLTAKASTAVQAQAAEKAEAEEQQTRAPKPILYPLRSDPKLRVVAPLQDSSLTFDQMLDAVRVATGLHLTLAGSLTYHAPDLGHVQPSKDGWLAFQLMEMMQEKGLKNGCWVKTADGYRLEGVSEEGKSQHASRRADVELRAEKASAHPSARSAGALLAAAALGILLIGVSVWHWRRAGS